MNSTSPRKGARTREAILEAALDEAAKAGLSGLTFGRLANLVGMSKSGLFAHFKGKKDLQLATLRAAEGRYEAAVLMPALRAEPGLPRLWALCQAWLDYAQGGVFENGCFFTAVAVEFDNRPGEVRERIVRLFSAWIDTLEEAVVEGIRAGQVREGTDARQVAFEINALMSAANGAHQLLGGEEPFERSFRAIRRRIEGICRDCELEGLCSDEQPALAGAEQWKKES